MPKIRQQLDAATLKSMLSYDEQTGLLTWKRNDNNLFGKIAGYISKRGYIRMMIDGVVYFAHRVIWIMQTGEQPVDEIDHVNGVKSDNRWINLRQATRSQNRHNIKSYKSSKSGLKGACYQHTSNRWIAKIQKDGSPIYLGIFDTPQEAHEAYKKAAIKLHGKFARFD